MYTSGQWDCIILGAGIIGLSTAYHLQQSQPQWRILVVESESQLAQHQTGRNSGVIHAGVYYPPQSLKAEFCLRGAQQIKAFCQQHQLPIEHCGKLIIATSAQQLSQLDKLFQQCQQRQLRVTYLTAQELSQQTPQITGQAALYISDTAITSYTDISHKLAELIQQHGYAILFNTQLNKVIPQHSGYTLLTNQGPLQTRFVVNCTGIMTDHVMKLFGIRPKMRMIPFKGIYYRLPASFSNHIPHLVYPVPRPNMPFLGIHLTRMIDGSVTVGPNASLALHRQGYSPWQFSIKEMVNIFTYPGFWRLLSKHQQGMWHELRSTWFKSYYLQQIQAYCPSITLADLQPYPSGIRAQAVDYQGKLLQDFSFEYTKYSLHVANAPSPGATSAFPIGEYIVRKIISMNE